MKQVEDIIKLVKGSIENGIATIEPFISQNRHFVRYFIGSAPSDDVQYIAKVHENEPYEVSIARRLLNGNLNIDMLRRNNHCSQEMIDLLTTIDDIRLEAKLYKDGAIDAAIEETISTLYQKEVTIYQNKIRVSPEEILATLVESKELDSEEKNLSLSASHGDKDAILKLDSIHAYQAVAKLKVPDRFCADETLRAVLNIGSRGVDHLREYGNDMVLVDYHPRANTFEEVNPGQIIKMDDKFYHLSNGILEIEGFKGVPFPQVDINRVIDPIRRKPTSSDPSL